MIAIEKVEAIRGFLLQIEDCIEQESTAAAAHEHREVDLPMPLARELHPGPYPRAGGAALEVAHERLIPSPPRRATEKVRP